MRELLRRGIDMNALDFVSDSHAMLRYHYPPASNCRPSSDMHACMQGGMRRTALHWACQAGNVRIVELLVDHGADTKVPPAVTPRSSVGLCNYRPRTREAFLMLGLPCRSGVPRRSWISCTRSACSAVA